MINNLNKNNSIRIAEKQKMLIFFILILSTMELSLENVLFTHLFLSHGASLSSVNFTFKMDV